MKVPGWGIAFAYVSWQNTSLTHFLCNPALALFSQQNDFLANLKQVAKTIF